MSDKDHDPAKGIESCWCGKKFFWQDRVARDEWRQNHIHAC